jgi:threonyl-tRNA synthetase
MPGINTPPPGISRVERGLNYTANRKRLYSASQFTEKQMKKIKRNVMFIAAVLLFAGLSAVGAQAQNNNMNSNMSSVQMKSSTMMKRHRMMRQRRNRRRHRMMMKKPDMMKSPENMKSPEMMKKNP